MTIKLTRIHWRFLIAGSIIAVLIGAIAAHANPSFFAPQAMSATATTTIAYMTPGTATSTMMYDSFNLFGTNQPVVNDPTAAASAALEVQFTASSSVSVLNIAIERSDDQIDWYQDEYSFPVNATSTGANSISLPNSFTWTYASSTVGGQPNNTSGRIGKIMRVDTPTRYTRAVFTLTGANGAVWSKFVPVKENK